MLIAQDSLNQVAVAVLPSNPRTPRRRWQGVSNLNLALQIENASAFQLDAIAHQATNDLSATPRGLESAKPSLAQALGPEGRQHAVRSAGHRIFRDALGWREVAADEVVGSLPRRGHDYSGTNHLRERRHIWNQRTQDLPALKQGQVVELVSENFDWIDAEGFSKRGRSRNLFGPSDREVQDVTRFRPVHSQWA